MSNQCPRCGAPLKGGVQFCPKCGVRLNISTPNNQSASSQLKIYHESSNHESGSKKNGLIVAAIVVAMLVAGGGFLGWSINSKKETERARLEQQRQDSIAAAEKEAARLDSLSKITFRSPDLALFNLHARVKTLETHDNTFLDGNLKGERIEFDENGVWINHRSITISDQYNDFSISRIKRDKNGYITEIDYINDMNKNCSVAFKWEDGRIASRVLSPYYEFGEEYFTYEDNAPFATINKIAGKFAGHGGISEKEREAKYSDYKLDEWGNWIERKVVLSGMEEYMSQMDGEMKKDSLPTKTYTEERIITYYDRE